MDPQPPSPPKTPPKTRADLKRELQETIPPGEEHDYLAKATQALQAARTNLKSLRAQRATLTRQIAVRERKITDWKGKIPRPDQPPTLQQAEHELRRAGLASCVRVADLVSDHHGHVNHLSFHPEFRLGLTGIDGFAKLWIIALAPRGSDLQYGSCKIAGDGANIYLWLVDIVSADVSAATLHISGLDFLAGRPDLHEISVLDVKPYLPYCEAWPSAPQPTKADKPQVS